MGRFAWDAEASQQVGVRQVLLGTIRLDAAVGAQMVADWAEVSARMVAAWTRR